MYDLQIIGLGSDGAAAMASDLNGLNALMTNDNPYTVFVHCVCHRLNLAVSQVLYTVIYSYIIMSICTVLHLHQTDLHQQYYC